MDLKISEIENKQLLSRQEGIAQVKSNKTASYAEIKKKLAEDLNKDENLIVIKKLYQKFGCNEMDVFFYAYDSAEAKAKLEKEKKKKEKAEGSK